MESFTVCCLLPCRRWRRRLARPCHKCDCIMRHPTHLINPPRPSTLSPFGMQPSLTPGSTPRQLLAKLESRTPEFAQDAQAPSTIHASNTPATRRHPTCSIKFVWMPPRKGSLRNVHATLQTSQTNQPNSCVPATHSTHLAPCISTNKPVSCSTACQEARKIIKLPQPHMPCWPHDANCNFQSSTQSQPHSTAHVALHPSMRSDHFFHCWSPAPGCWPQNCIGTRVSLINRA
jgi:hypothetical protein